RRRRGPDPDVLYEPGFSRRLGRVLEQAAAAMAGRIANGSTPDRARGLENSLELAPLIILRDGDVIEAAEAALRAQRQLFGRQVSGRLVDAPPQQVKRLQVGALGR